MQSDGLEEPVEGLATVAVTVAARAIEAHARDKEQAAKEQQRAQVTRPAPGADEPVAVNAGPTTPSGRPPAKERHPSQWATGDRGLTPKQQLTLAGMGYKPEELRGMSKSVASLHISGERSRDDLGKQAPVAAASASGTGPSPAKAAESTEQAPRRDPNLDLHRKRQQQQQQRRGRRV